MLPHMERERFIRSFDGTRLYSVSCGAGPPLILCDGLGCSGFIWRYLAPALAARHRVIRWHYRGHGLSEPPRDPASCGMEALRADLQAVFSAHEVPQAALLGHSMGAQVILDYALHMPQQVTGVVPICGSYGRPLDTFHGDDRAARLFPLLRDIVTRWPRFGQRLWRRVMLSTLAYQIAVTFEVNGDMVRWEDFSPYFEHLGGMDVRLFAQLLDQLQHHTVEDRLRDIAVPALVVAGERDTFTPAWLSRRMQQLLPNAELMVVPGGTHVAPIEVPELVILRVERFLMTRAFVAGGGADPVVGTH